MYSKIDYKSLKQLAQNALNELSSYSLDSIETTLNSSNVLPAEIRKKVNSAFSDIRNSTTYKGSFVALKLNLKKLVDVSDEIKKYQDKETEIKNFKRTMDEEKTSHQRKLKRLKQELNDIKSSLDRTLGNQQSRYF